MVLTTSQPGRLSGQFHLGHFWLSLTSFLVNIAGHNTGTEHSLRQTDGSLKTGFNTEVIYRGSDQGDEQWSVRELGISKRRSDLKGSILTI